MSTRGDDRAYKVVYSSRRRDDLDEDISSRRSRRDVEYEDDHRYAAGYSRDYRDERIEVDRRSRATESRVSLSDAVGTTKTRYAVGRDRNAESYVKRTDAVVIEDRPDYGRYDYEVLRPQRRDDGTYIVDVGGPHAQDYVVDLDSRGYDRSRYEVAPPSRRDELVRYESSHGGGRDRATRDITYKDVHVTEEFDEDRYSRRGRAHSAYAEDIAPPPRLRSAIRDRDHSPPALRRQASVGFFRDQISHHDASESRHERPGAEAHLAGHYLEGNGQYEDSTYAAGYTRQNRSRSRDRGGGRGGGYGPRRSDPRVHEYDEEDADKRTFTEETMRRYEYEDAQRPAYPPQRGTSRRRHRRHHRDDDDDDRYSQYDEEVVKRTKKEYYR